MNDESLQEKISLLEYTLNELRDKSEKTSDDELMILHIEHILNKIKEQ